MAITSTIKNVFHYLNRFLIREVDYYLCRPVVLIQFLTYRCTSKCQTCNMWTREMNDVELTLEEWRTVVNNLTNKKRIRAEIFGGDALLRSDILVPLINYMKQQGVSYIDMPTNCNLLDEKMAQGLVDSEMDRIYISLDSGDTKQDKIRGISGSFTKIKDAIFHLKKARGSRKHPKICINTTISNLNYDSFDQVMDVSISLGTDEVSLGYVGEFNRETLAASEVDGIRPNPYFASSEDSLRVNQEQAKIIKAKLKELKQKVKTLPFYFSAKNINVLNIENLTSGKFPFQKCYISHCHVSIDPYGNVTPCPFFPDYILGNLKEKPLCEIWNNEKHRYFMKKVSRHQLPMCFECIYNMERNPTFFQAIRQMYYVYTKKGLNEPTDYESSSGKQGRLTKKKTAAKKQET